VLELQWTIAKALWRWRVASLWRLTDAAVSAYQRSLLTPRHPGILLEAVNPPSSRTAQVPMTMMVGRGGEEGRTCHCTLARLGISGLGLSKVLVNSCSSDDPKCNLRGIGVRTGMACDPGDGRSGPR
jgi:hypothetical protein